MQRGSVAASSWRKQNVFMNPGWEGIALFSRFWNVRTISRTSVTLPFSTLAGGPRPYLCEEIVLPAVRRTLASCGVLQVEAGKRIDEHRDLVHGRASLCHGADPFAGHYQ